jgi:hypothetical protein
LYSYRRKTVLVREKSLKPFTRKLHLKIKERRLGTMTKYEIPIESKTKKSARIPIDKLHDFEGHPYKVTDNEDMDKLVESIKLQGIISPLIVRLKDNTTDEYEVILKPYLSRVK